MQHPFHEMRVGKKISTNHEETHNNRVSTKHFNEMSIFPIPCFNKIDQVFHVDLLDKLPLTWCLNMYINVQPYWKIEKRTPRDDYVAIKGKSTYYYSVVHLHQEENRVCL